eukprot:TRINITY_DN6467_c0_g1_i2.p1 TRINITY_DN6467_c0_g1~~TRINITY_DN6467_c0_g1_i2.p1  ORF type:complete len:203 (-),score=63.00 TRINITY_DN6467_c0_g1_i2:44-622(-)
MGDLFITSRQVIWLSSQDASKGFALDFPSISIHAVCRDPDSYPLPCIYCQLDLGDEEEINEVRFVPSDAETLDILFHSFSEGASLNPDPEDEGAGDFYYNADEVNSGYDNYRNSVLNHLDSVFQAPPGFDAGQFEDAEAQFEDADVQFANAQYYDPNDEDDEEDGDYEEEEDESMNQDPSNPPNNQNGNNTM